MGDSTPDTSSASPVLGSGNSQAPEASEATTEDSQPALPPTKKQNAIWTSGDNATLVATLKTARSLSLQADNGWKALAWTMVAEALVGGKGGEKKLTGCWDHWRNVCSVTALLSWVLTW